jgi:antitoxin CptB
MAESIDIRRKRLLYQARRRGTREADRLIGAFAERHLPTFGEAELDRFEALIAAPDGDLMDWLSGRRAPPEALRGPVLDLMIDFKKEIARL